SMENRRVQEGKLKKTAWIIIAFLMEVQARGQVCSSPELVRPERSLFITEGAVLKDSRTLPGGDWHFGTLITQMLPTGASENERSALVLTWLESFTRSQTLRPVPSEPAGDHNPQIILGSRLDVRARLIEPWLAASGG